MDLTGASRVVLRDWSTGKLPRYTLPPSPSGITAAAGDVALADVYAKDEEVLSQLQTRKEKRTSAGIVKLKPGTVETRKVVLDVSWLGNEEDGGEEDEAGTVSGDWDAQEGADEDEEDEEDEEEGDEDEDEDEERDGDEDEDEEEEEEEEEEAQPTGKRKRLLTKTTARSSKKVAFAAEPTGTKQARSAAGAKGPQAAQKDPKKRHKSPPKARPSKTTAKRPVTVAPKRVANSGIAATTKAASDGEEAYDFKKYF